MMAGELRDHAPDGDGALEVWIDQDLCTGDGLCVQYAPEVFEFDTDGLAYVKGADGELRLAPGSRVDVPEHLRLEVVDAARDCPGTCIHLTTEGDRAGRTSLNGAPATAQ
jgi:ferredoxin